MSGIAHSEMNMYLTWVAKIHLFCWNVFTASDIDSCISEFANIIDKASSSFKRKLYANDKIYDACRSSKNDTCNYTNNQPWFNLECFETRNLFTMLLINIELKNLTNLVYKRLMLDQNIKHA